MFKKIIISILFIYITACSSDEIKYDNSKLIEIYASIELQNNKQAAKAVKKYQLDDEAKRDAYYSALKEKSTDVEKWEKFLKDVDEYKIKNLHNKKKN